jgi:ADP-ribose pyrophosphatase YjhB (NUDIX family)
MPSVSAVVVGSKGILLIRRDKVPNKGLWCLPGGVVEVGETQEQSIEREVREEAGVESAVIGYINTDDIIYHDSAGKVEYQYMVNRYLLRAITEDVRPGVDESDASWFHPDKLPVSEMPGHLPRIFQVIRGQVLALMAECLN